MRAKVSFLVSFLMFALAVPAAGQAPAVESLLAAASADARNPDAQRALGLAYLRAGNLRDAQRALQAAQRLDRTNPARAFDVARVAFARGEYRPARTACRAVLRFRDSVLGRVCEARAFLVWNRSARAFEELEAALQQEATNVEALLALGDAHRLRAAVAEAEDAYRRAASAAPESALPYLGLGRLYLAAGRRQDAVTALRTAETKRELEAGTARPDAGHPEIAFELGRAVGGAQGVELLRRAVAGRPAWPEAQVAIGDALLAGGDVPGARAQYEEAVRARGNFADAHVGLARALTAAGEHEPALREIEAALELVPNHPFAVLARARLYEAMEQNEPAFETYRQAADLMGGNPDALLSAARLALRLNRDVLAVGFLDRVLQTNAELSAALELYGDAMAARRDRTRARELYERALRGRGEVARERIRGKLSRLGGGPVRRPQPAR